MITVFHLGRQKFRFLLSPSTESEEGLVTRKPDSVSLYSGVPMAKFWGDVNMEMEEREPEKLPVDWNLIFSSSQIITLSERGYERYGEMLSDFGEFLPARFKGEHVYVFHCTNIIECKDQEQTRFEADHMCGPIPSLRKIGFNPEMLEGDVLFRDKVSRGGLMWITTACGKSNLLQMFLDNQTGFELQPVAVYQPLPN